MSDLVTKFHPILYVSDPAKERDFYELFGLRTTYEGPEYAGFLAVGNDAVEFGSSAQRSSPPGMVRKVVTWQLGVSDVDAVVGVCEREGLHYEVTTEQPATDWCYRTVAVRSPNDIEVLFEGENEGALGE